MMQADDERPNADAEFEVSRPQRRRRSSLTKSKLVSALPNLSLLLLFYICFYSFLYGFYMLLLVGVTSTSVGGQQTLLWTFFYLGLIFMLVVSLTTYASQWENKTLASSSKLSNSSTAESSLVERKSEVLLNQPPPPPSASGDDDLDDIELSETKTSVTDDSKHIGDVDVS